MRYGKFVLTVNSIKTSRTRAKMWLILLGKQFHSVTQPRDKHDTESRRSADNLASLQTSSHSVYQAITFTSSLTERFDRDLRADKRFGGRSKESLCALDDVGAVTEQSSQVSTKSKFAPRHFR